MIELMTVVASELKPGKREGFICVSVWSEIRCNGVRKKNISFVNCDCSSWKQGLDFPFWACDVWSWSVAVGSVVLLLFLDRTCRGIFAFVIVDNSLFGTKIPYVAYLWKIRGLREQLILLVM